jgi:hypothetical protein
MEHREPFTEGEEKTKTGTEITADEQEQLKEGPDTEHETIQINVRTTFELYQDIDPVIIDG